MYEQFKKILYRFLSFTQAFSLFFLILQPKHILLVLKRTISFKHPKHMLEKMGMKIFTFTLKNIFYLNPFTKYYYRGTRAPSDGS